MILFSFIFNLYFNITIFLFCFRYTYQKSLQQQLKELTDSATQHERLADELNGDLLTALNQLITYVKGERKKVEFKFFFIYN